MKFVILDILLKFLEIFILHETTITDTWHKNLAFLGEFLA
jgi:hypothetical protein